MDCPYCGSDVVEYVEISDGGGDYGNAACDDWECLECGARFEGDCVEEYDPGLEGVNWITSETMHDDTKGIL